MSNVTVVTIKLIPAIYSARDAGESGLSRPFGILYLSGPVRKMRSTFWQYAIIQTDIPCSTPGGWLEVDLEGASVGLAQAVGEFSRSVLKLASFAVKLS
ncbi:MAG: hypothetical protein A3K00_10475 [Gallionellales bacterium RIFOXYD2_FULL_52_7]|nr:MAG: hypothetical protein A3K00_10475 [Gallionellales bacterium RIFOXYD2_FULL_52_7]